VCIDEQFQMVGFAPEAAYSGPKVPRRCRCLTCGNVDNLVFADIRTRASASSACWWCTCREVYECGIVTEPEKWNLTKVQAAELVLGDEFIVRGEDGCALGVADLATRMREIWDLVDVECVVCEAKSRWSAVMTLSSVRDISRLRCRECSAQHLTAWQEDVFAKHGLVRDHVGYAKLADRVEAHCADPECGAWRKISVSALEDGETPCLDCAEGLDPDAPHVVYLIHFPALCAYKIGITNPECRNDRIAAHLALDGTLVECHEVPNRQAARAVELHVLDRMRAYPSYLSASDLPQGGYTETWSDDAPVIDLGDIIKQMARVEAPGFDRLSKLRDYFADDPLQIDELVRFRRIEVLDVDGVQVHRVGLSETEEHVLRKIKARREARR
jgi:hypothetical protein